VPPPDHTYSYCLLTYNQAGTVADAAASALAQECPPLEIVISDDCSTDDTFAILQAVVAEYTGPHRVVLHKNSKNLGLAGNIAKIHDLSTGDIIIAAAGDDLSMPQRARRIMDVFAAHSPLLVCSHAVVIDQNGDELSGDFHRAAFYHPWTLPKVAASNSLYLGATGAWAREIYTKYGPLDPDAYEDLVFGFRAALEGRVHLIEEKLIRYRIGLGITTSMEHLPNADAYKAHRAKSFHVAAAVFAQRFKDAQTFGLSKSAKAWDAIRQAQTRAAIGQAYYQNQRRVMMQKLFRHPLIVLDIVYNESRMLRKFKRRAKRNTRNAK
jgi:glycosyltransferase involved in cell wall biosynthesis